MRKLCESEDAANRQYGLEVARKLRARLADLLAAPNCDEIVTGNPLPTNGVSPKLAITLWKGYRMIFSVNHPQCPKRSNGNIDWSRVTRLRLVKIENPDAER